MPTRSSARRHAAEGHALADEALLLAERAVLVLGEERVDPVPVLAVDDAGRDGVDVDPVPIRFERRPTG